MKRVFWRFYDKIKEYKACFAEEYKACFAEEYKACFANVTRHNIGRHAQKRQLLMESTDGIS
jgi:hypothetical protein